MKSAWQSFLAALSFLTRLGPARVFPEAVFHASVAWYPAVGLLLGLLCSLPILLGIGEDRSMAQAWCWLVLLLWLTRGLHADGLADLADGLGSGKSGEAFWHIIKDSRLGAFGAMAMLAVFAGQIILAAACIASGKLGPLIYAPMFGRWLAILLAGLVPCHSGQGLGRLVGGGSTGRRLALCHASALGCGVLLCGLSLAAAGILGALVLVYLARLARRHGGYNGDFLGTAVILGELCVLASAAL